MTALTGLLQGDAAAQPDEPDGNYAVVAGEVRVPGQAGESLRRWAERVAGPCGPGSEEAPPRWQACPPRRRRVAVLQHTRRV